ncbi:probable boron transporter 2 isoform X2 [Physcomitrium patens]|uniref:Bicarbonate transporter-like transmembrane domain-containing protein n=1 Tax=Physcomitrium patens TaxID=3218 RepID=A0A2K1J955_PHYPA|nr:probable boron transporter 2 isoform X2 [Physcomitrium patens]PNR38058.1 hypothetical protein PHYPA_021169 [Physcomitrium patens]|eukprot:XP_024398303.1 probable boron transporter 2 isoform X2 [Physcomitrella patens]
MGKPFVPLHGVATDIKARLACYKQDWIGGFNSGYRILAPTAYIFFASALPVIAFGEQLERDTNGVITAVQTLSSTAICGILQSVIGGQPLLIVGVSEPTSLMYTFMYHFVKGRTELGSELFLAWVAWVCVWSAAFLFILAAIGACSFINRFTRISGELFGMLIAVLFIQQAVKGVVYEFWVPEREDPTLEQFQHAWRFGNGMFGIVLTFGLLWTAMKSRRARSCRFASGSIRGFIADYGVPLLVVLWTLVSYAFRASVPEGIPRRLFSPNPWSPAATRHWTILLDMFKIPYIFILAAVLPAFVIAVLYYFDHSVSAQLAQQEEFNLRKPTAYHYDLLLVGGMVLVCGLLGLPPSHGVIPQSPMHTKALVTLKKELVRNKLVKRLKSNLKQKASVANPQTDLQDEYQGTESPLPYPCTPRALKELQFNSVPRSPEIPKEDAVFDFEKHIDLLLPVEVKEQRLSNLLQSLMVGGCIAAMPALKRIPTSVLWGYFAFMAIEGLPGNQFWERVCLLVTAPSRRHKVLRNNHLMFVRTVPFKVIACFTLFQLAYMLSCFAWTWIPVGGVMFPILIMLLIPARQHILPRFFNRKHLQELDAADYEETALPFDLAVKEAEAEGLGKVNVEAQDEEAMPKVVTSNQEEVRHSYTFRGQTDSHLGAPTPHFPHQAHVPASSAP